MSDTSGMHPKVKNFFSFLADNYLRYFSESPPSENEDTQQITVENKDDDFSLLIRHACDSVEHYQTFYFGWMALACNSLSIRPRIELFRNLHSNTEGLKIAISGVRTFVTKAKEALQKIESLPDEDIETFIKTLSRYTKLFTLVYFKQ